jgi:transcription initiation factor IIE alpha subunit
MSRIKKWSLTETGATKAEENPDTPGARFDIIRQIEKSNPATEAELSEVTGMSSGDVRKILMRLKGEDWVTGNGDDDNNPLL